MYAIQIVLVFIAVYLAPAVALRPGLLARPETALAIPFVSVLIVFLTGSVFIFSGLFSPAAVRGLSALAMAGAAIRIWRVRKEIRQFSTWRGGDWAALGVTLAFSAYVVLRLVEGGFDENDEIYSWNMWAIQHVLGEPPDYYYTQAPYPQLFPKLLAWSYMLIGDIDAQTAVKTPLYIFPASIFFTLGLAPAHRGDIRLMFLHAGLCLFLLKLAGLDSLADNGMPDMLTASAILASLFFYCRFRHAHREQVYLYCAITAGIIAALSKQPGLLWAAFSLPAIAAADAFRKKISWNAFAALLAPAVCALLWVMTEGRQFQDNEGVMNASFEGRGVFSQLAYAIDQWIFGEPAIFIVIAAAVFLAVRAKAQTEILILAALPFLLAWFFFAAYDLRGGAPALLFFGFIIAAERYGLRTTGHETAALAGFPAARMRAAFAGLLFTVCSLGGLYELARYKNKHPAFRVGDASHSNLIAFFGDDAGAVYRAIREENNVKLWTPTNYIYGLFYGHAEMSRPHDAMQANARTILAQLKAEQPDYVTNGGAVAYGSGGRALDALAREKCPDLFKRVAGPGNQYGIILYKLDKSLLDTGYCDA
ncbi:hypothetical protein [Hyphococcus sp.]|uniref:hypothetical protein n=1 Tax=Hyphococcus sp. TaxID=2038636 RepID=UPI003CCBB274